MEPPCPSTAASLPRTSADGVRLSKRAGGERVELERIRLAQSGQLTDLRFRVRDDGGK
jgi:DNA-binding TFAR19-related protein (PDSD5 family)